MAQDIRELFKNDKTPEKNRMPKDHEKRFLKKLEDALPELKDRRKRWSVMQIAASFVVMLGLSYAAFEFFKTPGTIVDPEIKKQVVSTKTLGDVSPDLKKVEDYYLANINLELSKVKLTSENKALFDSYILRLEMLNMEYDKLSIELTNEGPDELTINALINNLKLRLNLLKRLQEQLKQINASEGNQDII
jgi:hypothetical protein